MTDPRLSWWEGWAEAIRMWASSLTCWFAFGGAALGALLIARGTWPAMREIPRGWAMGISGLVVAFFAILYAASFLGGSDLEGLILLTAAWLWPIWLGLIVRIII